MSAIERIVAGRVVAVLRRVDDVGALVDGLVAGGIDLVEVTMDGEHAATQLAELRARGDVLVLAGTVRTPADAEAAVAAGAEVCVAPGTVPATIARCHELGVPMIPGALTPTEVERAWALGVAMVKLFPGSLGGPQYVRELRAPLPDVPLMVTGGVTADNAGAFIAAGATAIGAGSALAAAADVPAAARALAAAARSAQPAAGAP
jgi:2-dehydro-3-deoxyphosphogluconate aldolase/(4S)-4-hydroxy-2-oxoglutarate aldolase